MIIPNETLEAMRNELPRGAQSDIATELDFSEEYVSRVLGGKVPITTGNMDIIMAAQRIIRDLRAETDQLKKEFKNKAA